jgi:cytidylate kinase
MSSPKVVAIDGPAGSGKSTVAKLVASRLGLAYVDTGATYRIVAHRALQDGARLDDPHALGELAADTMRRVRLAEGKTLELDGKPIGSEIRTPEVSEATSIIAAHPEVRRILVDSQRRLVPAQGAVVEGRDIGTVVWPDADLKVYLDARPDVRAERRSAEHGAPEAAEVEVHERDKRDASRPIGPMLPAPDAIVLDTSNTGAEEVAERVLALLRPRPAGPFYTVVRGMLSGLLRTAFRMQVVGGEHVPRRGPVILAPNHRSLIDIPVAAAVTKRKVWFMGKEEIFRSSVADKLVRALGGFPVRRGRPDRAALQRALALLEQGEVVGIFPEGTRTPEARFDDVEEGFAYVALKSGAPIVPVAISGTEAVFPPGSKRPHFVKIRVAVGEAFRLGDRQPGVLPRGRIRDATVDAQRRLAALMDALEPT